MCCLGEAVDHDDDHVEAVGLGQTLDEVHSEVGPWLFRHWQGLEEACWFGVLELSMLANKAPANKIVSTQSPRHHILRARRGAAVRTTVLCGYAGCAAVTPAPPSRHPI